MPEGLEADQERHWFSRAWREPYRAETKLSLRVERRDETLVVFLGGRNGARLDSGVGVTPNGSV